MANIQGLAIIAVLVTLGAKASIAMPPRDIPAEVKSCKAISDDKDRLKCFDGLFGGPSKPPKSRVASTSSPVQRSSVVISRDTETPRSSRYILPQDLDAAIQQLDDQELERLVLAALEERARRKKPLVREEVQQKRHAEAVAVSLPRGKLYAVRAAFKAGVTPNRIAREFGLSRSNVQRALVGEARKQ